MVTRSSVLMLLGLVVGAAGHGYVVKPPGRVYQCSIDVGPKYNKRCDTSRVSAIQVRGEYPKIGPRNAVIASGSMAEFRMLDEQSATRWWKHPMKSGRTEFEWKLTAPHPTKYFSYYITKPNWNPNEKLSVLQFEDKAFCFHNFNGRRPDRTVKHWCDVPSRNGYHIILSIWKISDTARQFMNVIDIDFNGKGGGGGGYAAPPVGLEWYQNHQNGECCNATPKKGTAPDHGKGRWDWRKGAPTGPPLGTSTNPTPPSAPAPKPPQQTCQKVQGYSLCQGNDNRCCSAGTKCYAYSNQVSVCLQTCPAGWECAKGSQCQVHGGYHLCQGKQWCCPKNTKCYAYNNQVSACMAACPQGWRC